MAYKYYTDDSVPMKRQKLIRFDGYSWEQWGNKDKDWYLNQDASGIMIGLNDWVWYDEITEEKANEIIRAKA
jgi:hypothetical protein